MAYINLFAKIHEKLNEIVKISILKCTDTNKICVKDALKQTCPNSTINLSR